MLIFASKPTGSVIGSCHGKMGNGPYATSMISIDIRMFIHDVIEFHDRNDIFIYDPGLDLLATKQKWTFDVSDSRSGSKELDLKIHFCDHYRRLPLCI